ncbi:hypothetical protein P167DRAFT_569783 [Morchella conica CCBAS932]|uniref:Uncharacterized protein n=1 Tax=Morchella conica CCBAS932 TaxID=1392247 RepID=A0A3N4L750_9PEZI|nr:hypothetical protein P167DRAFT_569783 [Morchella conica CCBAS932]
MPARWRCCKCDNGPMTVKQGENVCTWSECQHVKCNGCDEKMMSVPLGPFSGPPLLPEVGGGGRILEGWTRGFYATHKLSSCEGPDEGDCSEGEGSESEGEWCS